MGCHYVRSLVYGLPLCAVCHYVRPKFTRPIDLIYINVPLAKNKEQRNHDLHINSCSKPMANERPRKRMIREETPEDPLFDDTIPIPTITVDSPPPPVSTGIRRECGTSSLGETSRSPALQWTRPKKKLDSKTSYVWDYFTDGGVNSQKQKLKKCALCPRTYVFCGSTTNMRDHLAEQHGIKGEKPQATTTQQTIGDILEKSTPHSTRKMEELHDALLTFIVDDIQPFHILKSSAFKDFCLKLDPKFQVPAPRTIKNMLHQRVDKCEQFLQQLIHDTFATGAITTDLWTSEAQMPFIGLTLHWLSSDFDAYNPTLAIAAFPYPHAAEDITNIITTILDKWNIADRVIAATTDGAGNMKNAIAQAPPIKHVPCAAHAMQLTVKDGLEVAAIRKIVQKSRNLVSFFTTSEKQAQRLQNSQALLRQKPIKVIRDVPTRWNSTFFMLERLVRLRNALDYLLADLGTKVTSLLSPHVRLYLTFTLFAFYQVRDNDAKLTLRKLKPLMLTGEEWTLVEETLATLGPFELVTRMLSGTQYATLSMVMPVITNLAKSLLQSDDTEEAEVATLKDAMSRSLGKRWESPGMLALVSSFLDPRFKNLDFASRDAYEEVVTIVRQEFDGLETGNEQAITSPPTPAQERSSMAAFFGLTAHSTVRRTTELDAYIGLPQLDPLEENDPIIWWKANRHAYPTLAKLARKYLAIKATSVPSEQLFSAAGNIVTEKRTRLKPKVVSDLIFVKSIHKLAQ
jgi:zinc finger BED domain-containing protein 1 (E3 SUMO-protein ligase ZBED1)